jgi:hypothetical protein
MHTACEPELLDGAKSARWCRYEQFPKMALGCWIVILVNVRSGVSHSEASQMQRMTAFRPFRRCHLGPQGLTFGITAVTSISRSIRPATSPSRTQSNACHQSS